MPFAHLGGVQARIFFGISKHEGTICDKIEEIARSSNGRTSDSESDYLGSNPGWATLS